MENSSDIYIRNKKIEPNAINNKNNIVIKKDIILNIILKCE